MSVGKNHSELFERYLKGQMSPEEAHAFEREVMDDPFAQEALEGYEAHGSDAIHDIDQLKGKIVATKKRSIPFMRIAAAVALLIVGSFMVYTFTNQIEGEQLAVEEESIDEIIQNAPAPDTVSISKDEESIEIEEPSDQDDSQLAEVANSDDLKKDEPPVETVELKEQDALPLTSQVAINESDEDKADDTFYLAETVEVTAEKFEPEEIDEESNASQGDVTFFEIDDVSDIDSQAIESIEIVPQSLVADEGSVKEEMNAKVKKKASGRAVARNVIANDVVSGRVTDDTGEFLPGVNVLIKGSTRGVTTDVDGRYELPKSDNMTLVFSFVGFKTQEVSVGNRATVDVSMGGASELQEVVITGYGGSSREDGFTPAKPTDGKKAFKTYLENNLNYPEEAKRNNIEGTVILELSIDPTGKIDSIDLKRSVGYGCDEEATRLVREGPDWESAKKGNTSVKDKVRVKVKFKLD